MSRTRRPKTRVGTVGVLTRVRDNPDAPWSVPDAAWFRAHPKEFFYCRDPFPGELDDFARPGGAPTQRAACRLVLAEQRMRGGAIKVLVLFAPQGRARCAVLALPDGQVLTADPLDEPDDWALFSGLQDLAETLLLLLLGPVAVVDFVEKGS